MGKFVDRTNKRYGRLTAVCLAERNSFGQIQWLCRCDCGNDVVVPGTFLHSGHTRSCGCLRDEETSRRNAARRKYDKGDTSLRRVWALMKQRCKNPNSDAYHRYGGRGISVCSEWEDCHAFIAWARSSGYQSGLTLDRYPDKHGNYEPSNCRWATPKQQQNNTTSNVIIEWAGVRKTVPEWAEIVGKEQYVLRKRSKLAGWTPEDILFRPLRRVLKRNLVSGGVSC